VQAQLPNNVLQNLYGPTEAAIDVTAWRFKPGMIDLISIGQPIANTQIHILDEAQTH